MKHQILYDNEVSEMCRRERQGSNNSSCNFFKFDGTDRIDVLMGSNSSNNNNSSSSNSIGASKQRFRSYNGNRFSYIFHQQQSHALVMLMAVCLLLPLVCYGMPANLNETETTPALKLANNLSNEIVTNLEETSKTEDTANFIGSSLSETLEDTIRNAVKNEIELDSNPGSPALINALNVMPESETDTEKLVLVELPKVDSGVIEEKNETSKTELPNTKETNCDASSLVCKRVLKEDATSTTIATEIIDHSVALPAAAAVPMEATTKVPNIELEDTTSAVVVPIETTILPVVKEQKEDEFDVIEDNMRESRNMETKTPEEETKLKEASEIEQKNEQVSLIPKTSLEHIPSKDVLKSILTIEDKDQSIKAEPVVLNYQTDNITSTHKAESKETDLSTNIQQIYQLSRTTQNSINENFEGDLNILNKTTSADDAENSTIIQANESKSEADEKNLNTTKLEATIDKNDNANTTAVSPLNDLSGLISQPLIDELATSNQGTKIQLTTTGAKQNLNEAFTPKPLVDLVNTEISNNFIPIVSSEFNSVDVITPVVADHTDLYIQESTNLLNKPVSGGTEVVKNSAILNEKQTENEKENENENDDGNINKTLSITYQESLTATEPNILLEHSKISDLLDIAEIDAEKLPEELTTVLPLEIVVHNVIKKQGVEPLLPVMDVERTLPTITSTTLMPVGAENYDYLIETTFAPNVADLPSPVVENALVTELIMPTTTIKSSVQNTNDITEMSVVFAGKVDNDGVSTAKGSRSINSIHTESTEHHHHHHNNNNKASISFDVYPAGQTFNENLAEETSNDIGKALPTHRRSEESSNRSSTFIITASSCTALLFIVISVTIFIVSFQRQHGTLDIEMQEQRCGKDNQDDVPETCIKLLEVELPNASLALQTEAEAEIEECL